MQAEKRTFTEFISGDVTCVVPVYQRNYDWKREHCRRLFDDIKNLTENNMSHFIGTFVYKKEPDVNYFKKYLIIDGQQRITSVFLLARALYDFADDDLKSNINAKFLRHTAKGEMENACRLLPTEVDRDLFAKIINGDDNFTSDEKNSPMYINYDFLRKQISASGIEPQKFYEAIHKLNVVSIRLDNENPQEIFESLNSTGQSLTQADLIRNFLLMSLDYAQQKTLYKSYWLEIENLLRPWEKVESFILQYLISTRKSDSGLQNKKLSQNYLYNEFKRYFTENGLDTETCLREMYRYAKFFRRCIFNDATDFAKLPALDKKFYELTFLLKADNAPIVLMHLLDCHEKNLLDEATFIKFVDTMISLAFRAKICRRNGLDQQTAGNVLSRLGDSLDEKSFWRAITGGKGGYTFPNNEEFQAALTERNLSDFLKGSGLFKYFLYSLEKNSPQNLPAYSDTNVEHVLPKKVNAAWKDYLTARRDWPNAEQWINSLGNMVIVADKKEPEPLEKKKIRYAQSKFTYTRAICGYSNWTSNQIQARAKKLSKEALDVWTLPEEFNITLQSTANIFYLDSDFKFFKGKSPATLSISGTEMEMPHWNHMVREVVRQFYALDADTFRRATQLENVRRNLFTTEPNDFKIDDDFYMKAGFDTETCLKIIKVLAENFDKLGGGTNFHDEIWFTLRPERG